MLPRASGLLPFDLPFSDEFSPMSSNLHFDIERHALPNGLKVVLQQDRRAPLASLNIWYHVGSKNERPGQTGFAHLFEHMLFQGSANVSTNGHFQLIQEIGGTANGSTWFDRTNYYETVPSHHLERALWLESDRMGFLLPAMTQEKLDNQREVVINERRQRVDNQPYGRAYETLHELLFPEGHPYRWPVIGYVEDLEAASLPMVNEFFSRFYVPNNAVLTLAGDFEKASALELIARYFGDIPAGAPVAVPRPAMPAIAAARREVLYDAVKLPRIYMAWHAPPFGSEEWYALDLLASAMSAGKASVLYEELVYRRGLAQDATLYASSTEASSMVYLIATARPGVEPAALEAALLEQVAAAAAQPLPEEALVRSRNRLLATHYAELQTLERRADLISELTTYFDDPWRVTSELDRYRIVTPESVRKAAERWLAPSALAMVTVLPHPEGAAS